MDFGIHIGTRGCLTTRENIMAVASSAEAAGYAIIGVADHLIVPVHTDVRYPYTESGVWPGAPTGECFDAIATLSFLAGITHRIKLLTSVLVVPHRPPVLTAKLLTTADVLSGGRIIAGLGSGWMKEEFIALETKPFEERGPVTDAYIRAWKALWTQDRPEIDDPHVRFANVMFQPKPVSKPHPPLWIGGESAPALRRAAQLGDGWYPVSNNAHIKLNTPALLKAGIERLHRAAEKAGRDPASIDIAYVWFKPPAWTAITDAEGDRQMFTGSPAALLDDAAAFAAIGVNHLIVYGQQPTIEATLDVQQRFAGDVVRKLS
ncbi:MAG TPA: TIGR03619 family F420-dependent LLM class oxidoreductase [Rhodopila sp.]|jgi:probable F420-dependent oxidoreductase|nr:TIGR03619 family F420-dependent LLM class oxidoreductase [Rhodopila sp.]